MPSVDSDEALSFLKIIRQHVFHTQTVLYILIKIEVSLF